YFGADAGVVGLGDDENGRDEREPSQACVNDRAWRAVSLHAESDVSGALFTSGRTRIFSERLDHAAVRRSPRLDHALRSDPAGREIPRRKIRRALSGIETQSAPVDLRSEVSDHKSAVSTRWTRCDTVT